MSVVKHTPGEWLLDGEDQFSKVVSVEGWIIAESPHIHAPDFDDAEIMHVANMRLIAAAPCLLDACESLLGLAECPPEEIGGVERLVRNRARVAVAKAKGGAA